MSAKTKPTISIEASSSYEESSDDEVEVESDNDRFDDDIDPEKKFLIDQNKEFKTVGQTSLDFSEFVIEVSEYPNQVLYFRIRVCDPDLSIMGPWSDIKNIKTPKKFGKVLIYKTPFDENGFMAYAAIDNNKGQWINPILNGTISISASSYGDAMFTSPASETLTAGRIGWLTSVVHNTPSALASSQPSIEKLSMMAQSTLPPGIIVIYSSMLIII